LKKYTPHLFHRQKTNFPVKKIKIDNYFNNVDSDFDSTDSSSDIDENDEKEIIHQYQKYKNGGKEFKNGVVRSKRINKGKMSTCRYQDPDFEKIFFNETKNNATDNDNGNDGNDGNEDSDEESDESYNYSIKTLTQQSQDSHLSQDNLSDFIVNDLSDNGNFSDGNSFNDSSILSVESSSSSEG
jgi:hypothetical protein